jgi:hypothetical protein
MVPGLRKQFNASFSKETYQAYLNEMSRYLSGPIPFRLAETPVFVDQKLTEKILHACESIVDLICDSDFHRLTANSIPTGEFVPDESSFSHMISFDFAVCRNAEGELEPQLIEMQGFPTLYAFQVHMSNTLEQYYDLPGNYSPYLNGYNQDSYLQMLRRLLLGNHAPEHVILLELKPEHQKTLVDFNCTKEYTGIETVCITKLIAEGRKLFYLKEGVKTPIHRIYNRLIFDDLKAHQEDLGPVIDLTQGWDVEWVPHPNWFYRISKYTLPFIRHPFVPETFFLNEVKQLPSDLEHYVLKPLFSFAGQGVLIDVTPEDLEKINDPQHYILQRKVNYAEVIETPDGPAKVEIRMMYVWPEGDQRPHAAINLARISKGKMIGVRYNQDKEWVGGSIAYFEQSAD